MSAVGQKATSAGDRATSALLPRTDIGDGGCDVRFVPKTELGDLFDHLVGAAKQWQRDRRAELFCRPQIEDEFKLGRAARTE
jgi:hypothetical protein